MAPSGSCFHMLNMPEAAPLPSDLEYFTLTAQPATKVWREPGLPDNVSSPMIYTGMRWPLIVAEVTISGNWEMEWDQAGFVIFAGAPPCSQEQRPHTSAEAPFRRWVTGGLEFTSGELHVSCAAAVSASGADRSLTPLSHGFLSPLAPNFPGIRIKFERIGDALWVWYLRPQASSRSTSLNSTEAGGGWQKVREITGFFWGIDSKSGVWIGCYASRPMQWASNTTIQGGADDRRNGLWVEFEDLEII